MTRRLAVRSTTRIERSSCQLHCRNFRTITQSMPSDPSRCSASGLALFTECSAMDGEAGPAEQDEEQAAATLLLEANGLQTEPPAGVQQLEMFLQPEYPQMLGLSHFPQLVTLRLIQQGIEHIQGLSSCPLLRQLWLCENRIGAISGLSSCSGLQELYLHSNRITAISGVDALTNLRVLWLADNFISTISGLSSLRALQQLNLACNDIGTIGSSLATNAALTSLNLAANGVSRFEDVAGLSRLTALQELCLADPLWGRCPASSLHNYSTFMLAALPQLTALDTLLLAAPTKAAAAATFQKKALFYSMRRHTLRREAAELARRASASCQAEVDSLARLHGQAACAAKSLQQQRLHPSLPAVASSAKAQQELLAGRLSSTMQVLQERQAGLRYQLASDVQAAMAAAAQADQRLQLELSSGGNVRLEEGQPGDAWLAQCEELLSSRLLALEQPGSTAGGAGSINVLSVTRVHNRAARLLYERAVDALSSSSSGSSSSSSSGSGGESSRQQCSEHLFFLEDPRLPGELLHAAQHGVRAGSEYAARGLDEAVKLCSHVAAAAGSSSSSEVQVLVCKVHLGGVLQQGGPPLASAGHKPPAAGCSSQPPCSDGMRVLAADHPGATAVFRTVGPSRRTTGSQQQQQPRIWWVFDHRLVLPQFLLTFKHTIAGAQQQQQQQQVEVRDPQLRGCARALERWLLHSSEPDEQLQQQVCGLLQEVGPARLQLADGPTAAGLTAFLGTSQLSSVAHLSLHNCGLTSCAGLLRNLPCLSSLSLSCNSLTGLQGLSSSLPAGHRLAVCDASHNSIATWHSSWLLGLPSLQVLDVSFNLLTGIEQLQQLVRSAPQLQELDCTANPCQQHKGYALHTRTALLSLQKLDGAPVKPGSCSSSSISDAMLSSSATAWHSDAGPVCERQSSGGDWRLALHSLALKGSGLLSLAGLSAASTLVRLDASDNLLATVAGLEGCAQLQQLHVSDNLLCEAASLPALTALTALQQLDVSGNKLSSLAPLSVLTRLSQLCVDNNRLASLSSLTGLTGLLELYAAHNAITDMKEAERLAVLPGLVTLDLAANPLAGGGEGYKLWLLYKLRRLKVLDGCVVEPAELAAARARYSGLLTMSFLEEQLGDACMSGISCLEVSGLRIRELGTVFAAGTPFAACLTELQLDSNGISSLTALAGLRHLAVLKVNSNRLGDASAPVAASDPGLLLPSLRVLQAAGNGLTSLAPLQLSSSMPALRTLLVSDNELASLAGVEGLQHLHELVADRNKLRGIDADALSGLSGLQELHLGDNSIRSLSLQLASSSNAAPVLAGLRVLHLGGNRLADLADLEQLSKLLCLQEVSLSGNPVARKQVYRAMLVGRCARLRVIDQQAVTEEECATAAAMFCSDGAADAAALLPCSDARCQPFPPLAAVGPQPRLSASLSGKQSAAVLPAAAADVFAQLAAAGMPQQSASGAQLVASVPSIQSGVLILSGPAAFGLAGTGISGAKRGVVAPGSTTSRAPGNGLAGGGAGGLLVTAAPWSPARGAAAPSRQVPYRGY